MVPTRESGRSLRERLVSNVAPNGSGAVLGPRVATPDHFFRPDAAMPDAICWAGWLGVIREAKDDVRQKAQNSVPSLGQVLPKMGLHQPHWTRLAPRLTHTFRGL